MKEMDKNVYAGNGNGKMITDSRGVQMVQADMNMFETALRRQFPDGLVIPLPDYSLADLMELKEDLDNEREYMRDIVTFDGLVGKKDTHIVTDGILQAELRISPERYDRIYPDEESYPLDGVQADTMDWEDRAATRLLYEHSNDLTGAAVGVVIREDIMDCLYIESVPFHQFMQDVEKANCVVDNDARQLMALKNLYAQPLESDITVPECIRPLMAPVLDRYPSVPDTPEQRRAYNGELITQAEKLLANCRLLPVDQKNFTATFQGEDAVATARRLTVALNGRYAPDAAMAVRTGNSVEVSLFTGSVRERGEIMKMFRCEQRCAEIKELPFRNLDFHHKAVAFCSNGQLVEGHIGVEGLRTKHQYGLVAKQMLTGEGHVLLPKADTANPEALFACDRDIERFRRSFKGEYLPVAHFHRLTDFTSHQVMDKAGIQCSHDADKGVDLVFACAEVKGNAFSMRQLDAEDTALYLRHVNRFGNTEDNRMAVYILTDKYFHPEIQAAWQREQQFVSGIHDRMAERQAQLDRITHASLYGKANDLRIRCRIDGVQQPGMPLSPQDAKDLRFLADTAADLGRDTLNYRNFVHESRIKEIAANAFADILSHDVAEDRQRGITR